MTICIAATCAGQNVVVAASDRMVSAPFLTLEFDHPDAKIDQLSRTCVGLTAGDALVATDLFTDFEGMISQLQNPDVLLIAEHVKQRFVDVRRKLNDERVFRPRGISFIDFYSKGLITALPPDLAMFLDNQVQQGQLEASVIVAGSMAVDRTYMELMIPVRHRVSTGLGITQLGVGTATLFCTWPQRNSIGPQALTKLCTTFMRPKSRRSLLRESATLRN